MDTPLDKQRLIRNFSRCARRYDEYANIQRWAGERLLKAAPCADGIKDILEIGCGTGYYTGLLKEKFKAARIHALDISREMVAAASNKFKAQEVNFYFEDAEDYGLPQKYDLITSNASLQWLSAPEKALFNYRHGLKDKGCLAFSVFGPRTFRELGLSLKELSKQNAQEGNLSAQGFIPGKEWKRLLAKHFKKVKVSQILLKERYASLSELLNKIKYTGTRGAGYAGPGLGNRGYLRALEDIYRSKFKAIVASYQIIICKACV